MGVLEHPDFDDHEGVHVLTDPSVGIRAIVAVHSTALGPSAGGTRLWTYPDSAAALTDALRLSRAMSYKNAMAELPLGGGKAVMMKPDGDFDREALFEAYGRLLDRLGGAYITAEDVGMTTNDMLAIKRGTDHVAGLPQSMGASGDPSPVTAKGVLTCIKACVARTRGSDDLNGLHVAVQGAGHVGAHLCRFLAEAGARLTITDINEAATARIAQECGAEVVAPDAIYDVDALVFAPCALGGAINAETLPRLSCSIVAGAANNQLATPEMGDELRRRGILYAPDYVVNAGGIINVASEVAGDYDRNWVDAKVSRLTDTLTEIFERADAENRATSAVSGDIARERIAAAKARA